MKENMLSVIIPTFQREISIINRAVKSVQNQSYPFLEIVIVDDNENNSPLSAEIKEYCEKEEIIYIKQFGNMGACNARNLGAVNSNGEYIAFLDDDDEWFPSKASEQITILKKGYGLVFSKGVNVYEDSDNEERPYGNNDNFMREPGFDELLVKNYIGTTSQIMVTKECFFQVNGFDPQFPARQDYDFCIRVSQSYKLYGIDKILFKHYHHHQFQISKDTDRSLQGYHMLYKKYKKYYQNISLAYINVCCKIAKSYLHKGKYLYWLFWVIKAVHKIPTDFKYILRKSCDPKIV